MTNTTAHDSVGPSGNDTLPTLRVDRPSTAPGTPQLPLTLLVLVAYTILAVALFWPAWSQPQHWVGVVTGDQEQQIWFLRWTPFAIMHGVNPLFTDYINFPAGVNMMWTSFMPLPGLGLAPITTLIGPVVGYNAVVTLGVGLAGWCTYIAARRYVQSLMAAFVCGLVFAFSPFLMTHALGHGNQTLVWTLPLLFLLLDDILIRQEHTPRRDGLLLGLLVSIQFFSNEELAVSEFLVGAVGAVVCMLLWRSQLRAHLGYATAALSWGTAVTVILLGYPVYFQLFGPHTVTLLHPTNEGVIDFVNIFVPSAAQGLSISNTPDITGMFTGTAFEWSGYLGIPFLLTLVYIATRYWNDLRVRFVVLLLMCTLVLSLGPFLHIAGRSTVPLPWYLLDRLPMASNVLPARLSLFTDFFCALLLAIFFDKMLRSHKRRMRWERLAAGVALLTWLPTIPYPATAANPVAFFSGAARDIPAGSTALVAPWTQDALDQHAMFWQAQSGMQFRMPEGYFIGPSPHGHAMYGPQPTTTSTLMRNVQAGKSVNFSESLRRAVAADLHTWNVQTIIVGPMPHRAGMVNFFTHIVGTPPSVRDGVEMWSLRDGGALPQ